MLLSPWRQGSETAACLLGVSAHYGRQDRQTEAQSPSEDADTPLERTENETGYISRRSSSLHRLLA
jgi:hypothetical protein